MSKKIKICCKCKKEKLLIEFHKSPTSKDGLKYLCKECCVERHIEYSKKNKKKINKKRRESYHKDIEKSRENGRKAYYRNKKQQKEYREKNKDKRKEYAKEYRAENRDKIIQKRKEHYRNNKKEILEKQKEYVEKNKEKIKKYNKQWRMENREKLSKYNKNRQGLTNSQKRHRNKTDPQFKISNSIRSRIFAALKSQSVKKNNKTIKYLGCTFEFYEEYLKSLFTDGMIWKKYLDGSIHIDHRIPICSFDLKIEENKFKAFHYSNTQPLWAEENLKKGSKILNNV